MKFYKKFEPLLYLTDSKYSRIALTGGRGSMKTGHAIRGILIACTQKKIKCCCFRESAVTIKDSVKSEIDSIIDLDFKDKGFTSNQTEITHINGSRIFFKGLREINTNSIENLKGIATDTDVFFIDEGQSISRAVLDALIPTLRKKGCVLVVCYNRIDTELPIEQALYIDYENKLAPENTFFLEINYPEIEHLGLLSKEFLFEVEQMKKNKPLKYEELYLNVAKNSDLNKVVPYFTKDNIDELIYHKELDLYLSCDFNVRTMSWAVAHIEGGCYYYIDELCIQNTTTKLSAVEFAERYKDHEGYIYITGDASGQYASTQSEHHNYLILIDTIRSEFAKIKGQEWADEHIQIGRLGKKNPSVLARAAKFNETVLDKNNQRRIFVDEKCVNIRHAMKYLRYDDKGKGIYEFTEKDFGNDEKFMFSNHIYDATSYLIWWYEN